MRRGIYDLDTAGRNDFLRAYFGADAAAYPSRTPLPGLLAARVPLLFSVAELGPPDFQCQAATLLQALYERDRTVPPLVWVEGHNRISQVASFGVDDQALGGPLHRWLQRTLLAQQSDSGGE